MECHCISREGYESRGEIGGNFIEIGRRLILSIVTISGIRTKSTRNISCEIYGGSKGFLISNLARTDYPTASICFACVSPRSRLELRPLRGSPSLVSTAFRSCTTPPIPTQNSYIYGRKTLNLVWSGLCPGFSDLPIAKLDRAAARENNIAIRRPFCYSSYVPPRMRG